MLLLAPRALSGVTFSKSCSAAHEDGRNPAFKVTHDAAAEIFQNPTHIGANDAAHNASRNPAFKVTHDAAAETSHNPIHIGANDAAHNAVRKFRSRHRASQTSPEDTNARSICDHENF